MRGYIVMAMFVMGLPQVVGLAQAGPEDYTEVRDLSLDATGLQEFSIDAGAGSLDVTGVQGRTDIVVTATITVEDKDEEDAREMLEKRLVLTLERRGDEAELKSVFRDTWGWDANAIVDLDVHMPAGVGLRVDDGSGSVTIMDVTSDILVDDGSGTVTVTNAGAVTIDDGSGSISVIGAAGNVHVDDGSGTIEIRGVDGSVRIDDGSGTIRVDDVEHDLIIEDDGSGSLKYTNIRGTVEQGT